MDTKIERRGEQVTVTVTGRLDSSNEDSWKEKLSRAIRPRPDVLIVDLSGVDYCSSAGFRGLQMVGREMNRQRPKSHSQRVKLIGVNAAVMENIKIASFEHLWEIHELGT